MLVENVAKKRLESGQLAASFSINRMRTADAAGIGKACGFDWLFIDLEHTPLDLETASNICVAALSAGITPIARVPGHEHHHAARILDAGAQGVIVPHVDTAEEARRAVRACRYPPMGDRSLTGPLAQLGYESPPVSEVVASLNANTLVVVMPETATAIENIDSIAAVEGVDVVMIGTNDLAANLGVPGEFGHPKIVQAYERLIAATRKHGKHAGMGGIYDHALMQKYIQMGARFLLGGSDVSYIMSAAKQRSAFLQSIPLQD
jgi:2-keto-3-deoxy-L-rhamnonate aldolase RhmA